MHTRISAQTHTAITDVVRCIARLDMSEIVRYKCHEAKVHAHLVCAKMFFEHKLATTRTIRYRNNKSAIVIDFVFIEHPFEFETVIDVHIDRACQNEVPGW